MDKNQKTISKEIAISGQGLHTGKMVNVTFKPALENSGIIFKRVDLENAPIVEANIDNVVDTSRGTTIEKNGARIMTVEHCLSAAFGLDIDNLLIEVDGEETPIFDGSARFFLEALEKAEVVEQKAIRKVHNLKTPITFKDDESGVEFIAIPADSMRFSVMIDYNTKVLNTQNATLYDLADYKAEISNCRTFVFLEEMQPLIDQNLIRGGDFSNAIVFVNKIPSKEELSRLSVFFNKPDVEVHEQGILNNCSLNFVNEPARHKLLDLVGDLSLIGMRYNAHIIATHPGHAANVGFAKLIKTQLVNEEKQAKIPRIDPSIPPRYDINDIRKMLPHRYPFLLIDKIVEVTDTYVIGIKNVSANEPFFQGHFPEEPVMPGVLQIEAMAQCGGILMLSGVEDPKNYSTYFMKIDNVRFRQKVVPGDSVIYRLDLISPIRRGLVHMAGKAYLDGKVVMEAEMLAQVAKNK